MDIESKSQLADIKQDKLTFTREEIFDQLLNSGKVIEAEVTEEEEL